MCGGRGTRLDAPTEKPLVSIAGRPMIHRVLDALHKVGVDRPTGGSTAGIDRVVAAVSPHVPTTATTLRDRPRVEVIETDGDGYVPDLQTALATVEPPALTVAADLPLLAPDAVTAVLRGHADASDGGSLTVLVPRALKDHLGASVDDSHVVKMDGTPFVPAGINVVAVEHSESDVGVPAGPPETDGTHTTDEPMHVTYDARLAVNVNRWSDVELAEALVCD